MIKEKIEESLKTGISSLFIEVINESPNHNVPDGAESHFKVIVVSDDFENMRQVQRHQLIYKVLSEEMKLIHAIAIHPFTKTEWDSNQQSSSDSPDCLGGSS
ncbi:MAG: BolA/IbaG family iron-sulfur metabolism protein [Flavobacteriales bacterium]|jgi:BolA protein|nr:BolA/IbaG family iron-sulfur metabolism protein [Flavobacteriales bacterium]|tara:strand:+ start:3957 stop:4262 length:306 start_codon:yes stop_codon:yes gene_type:complete